MNQTEREHSASKAILYLRVSSKKQEDMGDGLQSQEARCREYSTFKGYEVVEVFKERISGSLAIRPAMAALLQFLRSNKKSGPYVVVIDSVTRFARDIVAHWHLREQLAKAGGILESPSIEFKENSHSRFVETVLAGGAQYQREINAEQTRDRMRGRVLNGYWPMCTPIGYRHKKIDGHKGKVLVRDEPVASALQEALEGFASGRFESQGEVKRFLEKNPSFPKDATGELRYQYVFNLLTRILYAGYVEMPEWGIPLRKGHHEPIISLATFQRNQQRLNEGARAPARVDLNADFPLRGMIVCASCRQPMTACWSKSGTGTRYPYYYCRTKGCVRHSKSVRRERLEDAFRTLLKKLSPGPAQLELAKALFKHAWEQRSLQAEQARFLAKTELRKIQKQIRSLLDRVVNASVPSVIKAYEQRIVELERSKAVLEETDRRPLPMRGAFDELFGRAMQFLSSPLQLWDEGTFAHKQMVLRLTFGARLEYCPIQGLRTAKSSLPFNALKEISHRSGEWRARRDSNP